MYQRDERKCNYAGYISARWIMAEKKNWKGGLKLDHH